jgi:poly(hydroxyalkanoate) depolymerase family esterase
MKTLFGAAMRKAAELTRRQNVAEATETIQRSLLGQGLANAANAKRRQKFWASAGVDNAAEAHLSHGSAKPEMLASPALVRDSIEETWEQLRKAGAAAFDARPQPSAPARKAPATPAGDAFLSRSFVSDAGAREYKIFVPSNAGGRKLPLIVMLHGCTQDPDDFALGTGMNRLAGERGFIVAYPKQSKRANQSGCWNWFNAADQSRDAGEPGIIAGMTRSIAAEFDVDAKRIYVAGLSAGGAMAAIMSATYPELYSGAGIHSGLAYRSATDASSAFIAMRGHGSASAPADGERRDGADAPIRTIVFHGATDQTVHPANADKIVAAARAGLKGATQETHQGRSPGGRSYTRTVIADSSGAPHVEHWSIDGLGHAWSGGSPEGSYTDPKGPDASREMLRFFLEKPAKHSKKPF